MILNLESTYYAIRRGIETIRNSYPQKIADAHQFEDAHTQLLDEIAEQALKLHTDAQNLKYQIEDLRELRTDQQ